MPKPPASTWIVLGLSVALLVAILGHASCAPAPEATEVIPPADAHVGPVAAAPARRRTTGPGGGDRVAITRRPRGKRRRYTGANGKT